MNSPSNSFKLTPYDYVFESADFPLTIKPQFNAQPLEPHTHERFHEIVLVVSGRGRHSYENCEYTLGAREIFVVPPGLHHGYSQCEHIDYYNILVDFRTLKLPLLDLANTRGWQDLFVLGPRSHVLGEKKPLRGELDFERFDYCVALLERMFKLQAVREAGYRMAMLALFADFLRTACRAGESPGEHDLKHRTNIPVVIGNIATVLSRYCDEDWPVQTICRRFGLSRPVLFREFQKYYHMSPVRFLNRQRLRKAMSLLSSSDMALEAIAIQCGFGNGSYFSTAFVRQFGITPLKFRRNPEWKPSGEIPD